jgi:hypothetical protein
MTILILAGLMTLPLAMLWRWQPDEHAFELAAASSHAMKDAPTMSPNAAALARPAQGSPAAISPEAVAAPARLGRDEVAAKDSPNPAGISEHARIESATASVGAAPSRNEKPASASSPLRASGKPFDSDRRAEGRQRAHSKWQIIRHCWSVGQLVERSSTSNPSCVRSLDSASGLTAAF